MTHLSADSLLRKARGAGAMWLAAAGALWIITGTLWIQTSFVRPHVVTSFFITLADALIVAAPLLLLPVKWMGRMAVALVWLMALFVEVNLLYFRFFNDLTPFPSFLMAGNFGEVLFRSTLALVRRADVILLVTALSFTVLWWVWWRPAAPGQKLSRRSRLALGIGALVMFAAQQVKFTAIGTNGYINYACPWSGLPRPDRWLSNAHSPKRLYSLAGFAIYTSGSMADMLLNRRSIADLTPEQTALVEEATKPFRRSRSDYSANRRKNLILIIVESFNSWPVGKIVNGRSVTPVIDSLMRGGSAIWSRNMVSQIGDGGSSDGQMFYNTGLAPLSRDAAVQFFAVNRFESLAVELKRTGFATAVEVIPDNPSLWNHSVTSRAWGYDILHHTDSLKAWSGYDATEGGDGIVLGYAAGLAPRLPQPFLLEVTTISMHAPFSDNVPSSLRLDDPTLSDADNNFMLMTRYFDSCLGRFLENLHRDGLADNSIIVVAADHAVELEGENRPIFFMALNAGGYTGEIRGSMGQIDVYPTLLEITGRLDGARWQGLGVSVADGNARGALMRDGSFAGQPSKADKERMLRAFDASDLIIRSNYFEKHPQNR